MDPILSNGGDNHDAILLHDTVPWHRLPYQPRRPSVPSASYSRLPGAVSVIVNAGTMHVSPATGACCPFITPGAVPKVSRVSADRHAYALRIVA